MSFLRKSRHLHTKTLIMFFVAFVVVLFGLYLLTPTLSHVAAPTVEESPSQTIASPTSSLKYAAFLVFTNGTKRIFTDTKYHNQSPDVYLEFDNPEIIKITKPGITWQTFFETLPMSVTTDCLVTGTSQTFCTDKTQTLKFYVNGVVTPNMLTQVIKNGDQLLISFGDETDEQISAQLEQLPQASDDSLPRL